LQQPGALAALQPATLKDQSVTSASVDSAASMTILQVLARRDNASAWRASRGHSG
jgi:hypothetical protein